MFGVRIIQMSLAVIISGLLFFGCAIGNGSSDNERGYTKCESNEDCVGFGLCVKATPFNYCVSECTTDDDCKDKASAANEFMTCTGYRCAGTGEKINEDIDGDADTVEADSEVDGDTDAVEADSEVDGDTDAVEADTETVEAELESEVEAG